MTSRNTTRFVKILSILLFFAPLALLSAQQTMPEALETGTIEEQYQYLEDRTRIYENFRAIREDMFQQIMNNSNDSLELQKGKVSQLQSELRDLENTHEAVQEELKATQDERDLAIKNRDRLILLGIPMAKQLYKSSVWIIEKCIHGSKSIDKLYAHNVIIQWI